MVWTGVRFKPDWRALDELIVDTAERRQLHDELLAEKPEAARHDADICPFCVDKAALSSTASDPSGSGHPDVPTSETSTEGGTRTPMSDNASISQEAHDALVAKAVKEAIEATEKALETKATELASAGTKISDLEKANEDLTAANTKLNSDLDEAQVKLTAANEEVSSLKEAATEAEKAAAAKEIASKRVDQVKNLKLFEDEFVTDERASRWAALTDEAWDAQVDEWKALKPATTSDGKGGDDTASAMTGTSGLTDDKKDTDEAAASKVSNRRAVLAL